MKCTKWLKSATVMLTIAAMIFVMAGCDKEKPADPETGTVSAAPSATAAPAVDTPAPTATAEPTAAPTDEPQPTAGTSETTPTPGGNKAEITNVPIPDEGIDVSTIPPVLGADGAYHVRNIKELLGAIGPETTIVVEPGNYNLTDYLAEYNNDGNKMKWNQAHQYVRLNGVFDGTEIQIINVEKLTIRGGSDDPKDTQIVTEPRYASVFSFKNCKNISLSNMTLGHTDAGDCSGNVVDLISSCWVSFYKMDLFGCGVYGIGSYENSGDVYVTNSTIRDCSYGPFEIYDPDGAFEFTDCTLTGSAWGGSYWASETSAMRFIRCKFGQSESNAWYFRDDAYFEDCDMMEPTDYPDYGDYGDYDDYDAYVPPVPDLDNLTEFSIGDEMLYDIYWVAWQECNTEEGTFTQLDYFNYDDENSSIALSFFSDPVHTGLLSTGMDVHQMTWYFADTDYIEIDFGDRRWFASMFVDKNGNMDVPEPKDRWLCVWTDTGRELWFYKY